MLKQLIRQVNMFRNLQNPGTYLATKYGISKRDPLLFKLRNGVQAEVPLRLLTTFKEPTFGEDYISGFPRSIIRSLNKPTVVDVGANAGYFSLWWLSRFPGSTVTCVEPIPENFAQLKRNADLNPREKISLINGAVDGQNGEITLRYTLTQGFTTAASSLQGADGQKEISVKCYSLAQLMGDYGMKQIDFLKLDCEGSEYAILYKSSDNLLKNIRRIALEAHYGSEIEQSKNALCGFLVSKKFKLSTKPDSAMVYAWRE